MQHKACFLLYINLIPLLLFYLLVSMLAMHSDPDFPDADLD